MSKLKVAEILTHNSENHALDFKWKQYDIGKNVEKKWEFLKDVSSMANHPSDEDKYIVIGTKEKNGIAAVFQNINEIHDSAQFKQYLDSNVEPEINFELVSFKHNGYQLAYFRIYNNQDRPYLFKKDIKSKEQKVIYRQGQGLLRVGTSTRNLMRKDFDDIYSNKLELRDRREDIDISTVVGLLTDSSLISGKKFFDLNVENKSTKSIAFDIEMRLTFSARKHIKTRHYLESNVVVQGSGGRYDFQTIHFPSMPNLFVHVEEDAQSLLVERSKRPNQDYAVRIAQNSTENHVFSQELIIDHYENFTMYVEVFLRSDEFTEGPLIIEFDHEIVV